tara:strand:+ start:8475 stop:8744 length:270 start_codon:yes stop_codon:yes gene_type:complete
MSIKIVLPSGKAPKACRGTKIYTEDGHEIKGVTGCNIEIMPDGVVMARLSVFVEDVKNLDQIKGQVTIVNPENKEVEAFISDLMNEGKQ